MAGKAGKTVLLSPKVPERSDANFGFEAALVKDVFASVVVDTEVRTSMPHSLRSSELGH